MVQEYKHIPVMLEEVLDYLNPQPGGIYIDCTVGGGGHGIKIARRVGPDGLVIGIDLDEMAINNLKEKNYPPEADQQKAGNLKLVHDNFKNLHKIYQENKPEAGSEGTHGIILDLGLSSAQLEDRTRGFSFQLDAPLNMVFGQTTDDRRQTTEFIINGYTEKMLADIIYKFGEERCSRRIAKGIVQARIKSPIKTTRELVEVIRKAVPASYRQGRIHFATRTFQALRIETNQELENLELVLPQAVDILGSVGRLVIISYHSLEDRIVKNFFKKESRDCICPREIPDCRCEHKASIKIIAKKVVRPSGNEIKQNPKARSAKMRVAEKI